MAAKNKPLTVMVSSTVYGIEELLNRIYSMLTKYGYEVWMSHRGTVSVRSTNHAFDDCLRAVKQCDLFLSIITPQYGSGIAKGELSITHQELLKAIELNKPRWVLADDKVVFARTLLDYLGHEDAEARSKLELKKKRVIDDLRVIDMYEAATRHDVVFQDRKGNWVQPFVNIDDALLFATAQFNRYEEAEKFLEEQLADTGIVRKQTENKS